MTDELSPARFRVDTERDLPTTDGGEVVASFQSHGEAQRAVNELVERGFPVDRVAIVARGLRLVEHIIGPVGHGRAAIRGAVIGAVAGAFGGGVLSAVAWPDDLGALAAWGLVLGLVIGVLVGLLHRPWRRGQSYASTTAFEAAYFDVVAPADAAEAAARILDDAQRRVFPAR
jgi:hypothetical protein